MQAAGTRPRGCRWGMPGPASARRDAREQPAESTQREVCNCGYARGRCEHFPAGMEADAVRFSMGADGRLIYIFEKDHAPLEHGVIDAATDPREPLASLARAFKESHRQKVAAPGENT